ncbi:MAG: hypothetical protein K2L11_03565 [Muribaculaceae bacterium]|nr:hypothetical protein [Muribaculaceae bacterium]
MKRQILVNGLLSLTAVSMLTACVDDKYDLSDIDTTSRFTVDNLTVPVNLSEIKLENVINLDDNENISEIDGKYAITKGGEIAPTEFHIASVSVAAPHINSTKLTASIPGVSEIALPELTLPPVIFEGTDKADYEFSMQDIDKALVKLADIKTKETISIKVKLSIPTSLAGGDNKISFSNIKLQLPWGLITDNSGYDQTSGILTVGNLPIESDGTAIVLLNANGLALGDKGEIENGTLAISGQVGILGGELNISVKNTVVPGSLDIHADYEVSSFELASFSGKIDYNMDAIHIDPITLNDLPDFLDSPETNLVIANPQILISVKNPVGKWLAGKGQIILTSNFKNGQSVGYPSAVFTLAGEDSNLAFCTPKDGYTLVEFDGLRNVLTNGDSGLPSSIDVNIKDINFAGDVIDFPLGDLGNAEGSYEFNAPLGFGKNSKVVYESTESGWGSEDLDKVNITHVSLKANCTTNLPVSVKLKVFPVDKNGNEIAIDENAGNFHVPAMANNEEVSLIISAIKGTTIKDFDGVRFVATVEQPGDNTEAIGPDLFIKLDKLSVTVAGYYDTDF